MNLVIGEVTVKGVSDAEWNKIFGQINIPLTFQLFKNDTFETIINQYFQNLIKQAGNKTPVGEFISQYYQRNIVQLHIHDIKFWNNNGSFTLMTNNLQNPFCQVKGNDNQFSVYICNH